jgi:Contractile injection system tube protein
MPKPAQLEPAVLEEVWLDSKGKQIDPPTGKTGKVFKVQFNPQTLKLNYSNQKSGGEQPKGSSTQFVGRGVTKLSLELWFDIALALPEGSTAKRDVRTLTQEVQYFMTPQKVPGKGTDKFLPPGLRFQWGSFTFVGVMDSMDETLDFFSSDGMPLRANVAITASKQEIQYDAANAATVQNRQSSGLQAYTPVKAGSSLQGAADKSSIASSSGGPPDWKGLALANDIENPRMLAAGALLNLSASVSVNAKLGVTAQTSGSLDLSASAGASGGTSAGGGVSLGFVAKAGAPVGATAGLGGQASAGSPVGAGASFGASASF